jgi:hypothetical protein
LFVLELFYVKDSSSGEILQGFDQPKETNHTVILLLFLCFFSFPYLAVPYQMVLFNYVLGPRDFSQEDHFGNDWKVVDIDQWVTGEEEEEGDEDKKEEDYDGDDDKEEKKKNQKEKK